MTSLVGTQSTWLRDNMQHAWSLLGARFACDTHLVFLMERVTYCMALHSIFSKYTTEVFQFMCYVYYVPLSVFCVLTWIDVSSYWRHFLLTSLLMVHMLVILKLRFVGIASVFLNRLFRMFVDSQFYYRWQPWVWSGHYSHCSSSQFGIQASQMMIVTAVRRYQPSTLTVRSGHDALTWNGSKHTRHPHSAASTHSVKWCPWYFRVMPFTYHPHSIRTQRLMPST